MKQITGIIIALLVGITSFSAYKYLSSFKERYDLLDEITKTGQQLTALQGDKANLLKEIDDARIRQKALAEENAGLQEQLRVSQESLQKMRTDYESAQKTVEELNSQIAAASAENKALFAQVGELKVQAAAAVQQKEMLQSRLNSLAELKKAVRDLKRRLSGARREIDSGLEKERIVIGNGGFMIKDGKPTYPARVKIEVVPLPAPTNP